MKLNKMLSALSELNKEHNGDLDDFDVVISCYMHHPDKVTPIDATFSIHVDTNGRVIWLITEKDYN